MDAMLPTAECVLEVVANQAAEGRVLQMIPPASGKGLFLCSWRLARTNKSARLILTKNSGEIALIDDNENHNNNNFDLSKPSIMTFLFSLSLSSSIIDNVIPVLT